MTRLYHCQLLRSGRLWLSILALTGVALTGCGSTAVSSESAPPQSFGQTFDDPLPAAVLNARLETSSGEQMRLGDLRGKVVVVSDVMTLCQESCPLDTGNIVAAARKVQRAGLAGKVIFLSISIDPARDTPARMDAYRRLYSPAPSNWLTVTGAPATVSAVWQALGVYIQKVPDQPPLPRDWLTGKPLTYDLTHSDEVFFLDAQGNERFILNGLAHLSPGAPMPPALRRFLDDQGMQNLNHPGAQAWTLPQLLQVLSWMTRQKLM